MYGTPAMSKDLNLPFPVSPFKLGKEEHDLGQQQQNHQMSSSGLLRYRSAPNNVLGDVCDETAAESMFTRFVTPDLRDHFGGREKQQSTAEAVETVGFPSSDLPHTFFHSSLHEQQKQQHMTNLSSAASGVVENSNCPNLIRHDTSPTSFFSNLNIENGFGRARGIGGFSSPGGSGSSNAETRTNSGRLKGQISFSSRQGSSGIISQISEIGSEGLGGGSSSPENAGRSGGGRRGPIPGFPVASWEDSVLLSDSFSNGKRIRDPTEAQNHQGSPTLAHHFSLPKSSLEMAAMERFLQFQDAVPCKIRAKRGCATHPRSIAERVRRTRISERMRKLQELVPNMDKQTNTADMLDLAVNYIKDLQKQTKMFTENRAMCKCSSGKQMNSGSSNP